MKIYQQICNRGQTAERIDYLKSNNIYYERHHIIPRCCNGINDKSNITCLTAREHYICHALLYKISMCNDEYSKKVQAQLAYAYYKMSLFNKKQLGRKQGLTFTSWDYARLKEALHNAGRINNPWERRSEESKQQFYEMIKQPKSEEQRKKISQSNKGKVNLINPQTNELVCVKGKDVVQKYLDSGWITASSKLTKLRYRNKVTGEIRYITRNDPLKDDSDWEPSLTGYAAFVNKVTGESTILSKDDPRRQMDDWVSTSAGREIKINTQTFETKCVSTNDPNYKEPLWINQSKGKLKCKNKSTGEICFLLINDPRRNDPNLEICSEWKCNVWYNWKTKEILQTDLKDDKIQTIDWIHITPKTEFVNVITLERKTNVSIDWIKNNCDDWAPNSSNAFSLLIDTQTQKWVIFSCSEEYDKNRFKKYNVNKAIFVNTQTNEAIQMTVADPRRNDKQWILFKTFQRTYKTFKNKQTGIVKVFDKNKVDVDNWEPFSYNGYKRKEQ